MRHANMRELRHENCDQNALSVDSPADDGFAFSQGNVYAEFGARHTEAMLIKAQPCAKIQSSQDRRALNQRDAAKVVGIPQGRLPDMLRKDFRGIS